jgi:hypothetical protein
VSDAALLQPNRDVVFEFVDNAAVLVHLRTNRIYSLNETGARLWHLLVEGCSREQITVTLLREFEIDPRALEIEIDAIVALLTTEQLAFQPKR